MQCYENCTVHGTGLGKFAAYLYSDISNFLSPVQPLKMRLLHSYVCIRKSVILLKRIQCKLEHSYSRKLAVFSYLIQVNDRVTPAWHKYKGSGKAQEQSSVVKYPCIHAVELEDSC